MQRKLAVAPTAEDLEELYFDVPVIVSGSPACTTKWRMEPIEAEVIPLAS